MSVTIVIIITITITIIVAAVVQFALIKYFDYIINSAHAVFHLRGIVHEINQTDLDCSCGDQDSLGPVIAEKVLDG